MKKGILYLLSILLTFKLLFLSAGCANIIPPTGGPRDTLPPDLLQVTPRDSSLNFTEKRISFYFDEFVDVQNIQENLIVSPTLKNNPVVEFKLRTVTVRIKDTLDPNTTYSLNFGNAIRDINEGNELKNHTYVFSTGTTIDNNKFFGHVQLAESGKIDSTLIVLLHRSADDSAVFKERPRYYARLDGKGDFTFRNLPPGTFYAYTLKDDAGNRRYASPSQLFGFADKPIAVSENTPNDTLFAYVESAEEPRRSAAPAQTAREKRDQPKRLIVQNNLDGSRQDLLGFFTLQFATPLKTFDSTKLVFTDFKFQPLKPASFIPDSLYRKFTLKFPWQPDSTYNLILDKTFAEDSLGNRLLKTDTITFKAKKTSDYSAVRLRFTKLDLSSNPVLQFVQSDKVVDSSILSTREYNSRRFRPGEYELRILFDRNRNGKWDPGSFFGRHLQPERILLLPKLLKVKAGIDVDDRYE